VVAIKSSIVDKLLLLNSNKSSNILAGRIAAKLGDIALAQQYFKNFFY
jgi:hypothetical protein